MKTPRALLAGAAALVGAVLVLGYGLDADPPSVLGCCLIVAAAVMQPGSDVRTAGMFFLAPPLLALSGLLGRLAIGSPLLALMSYLTVFAAMLALLAPSVLSADRLARRALHRRLAWMSHVPYARQIAIGVVTAAGSAAALLWAEGVGNDDVAAVHLALFAGVAATTLEIVKEDRRRAGETDQAAPRLGDDTIGNH